MGDPDPFSGLCFLRPATCIIWPLSSASLGARPSLSLWGDPNHGVRRKPAPLGHSLTLLIAGLETVFYLLLPGLVSRSWKGYTSDLTNAKDGLAALPTKSSWTVPLLKSGGDITA